MEKKEIVPIQIVDRNPPMSPTPPAKSKLAARVKLGQAEAYIYNETDKYIVSALLSDAYVYSRVCNKPDI